MRNLLTKYKHCLNRHLLICMQNCDNLLWFLLNISRYIKFTIQRLHFNYWLLSFKTILKVSPINKWTMLWWILFITRLLLSLYSTCSIQWNTQPSNKDRQPATLAKKYLIHKESPNNVVGHEYCQMLISITREVTMLQNSNNDRNYVL